MPPPHPAWRELATPKPVLTGAEAAPLAWASVIKLVPGLPAWGPWVQPLEGLHTPLEATAGFGRSMRWGSGGGGGARALVVASVAA